MTPRLSEAMHLRWEPLDRLPGLISRETAWFFRLTSPRARKTSSFLALQEAIRQLSLNKDGKNDGAGGVGASLAAYGRACS
jgi:hypothetical protein